MDKPIIGLLEAARLYGIPAPWLKDEAAAGSIPHLRIGRQLFFNPDALGDSLARLAGRPDAVARPSREAANA